MTDSHDITELLNRWVDGDEAALSEVTPLVYDELKVMAQRIFSREHEGHTLQPTALVHEAYANLVGIDAEWQNRAHFYALAARMMRRLLVNHANARRAQKRGGDVVHVTLHEELLAERSANSDVLELDLALQALSVHDDRKSTILVLHYFGGLTQEEIAIALALSESTVRRELRVAKIWLKKSMSEKAE